MRKKVNNMNLIKIRRSCQEYYLNFYYNYQFKIKRSQNKGREVGRVRDENLESNREEVNNNPWYKNGGESWYPYINSSFVS